MNQSDHRDVCNHTHCISQSTPGIASSQIYINIFKDNCCKNTDKGDGIGEKIDLKKKFMNLRMIPIHPLPFIKLHVLVLKTYLGVNFGQPRLIV